MSGISKSTASIRAFGEDLNPTEITELLGCQPTKAAKTGDVITMSTGQTRSIKKGHWILEYGESDSVELEIKIQSLLSRLTDDLTIWKRVTSKYHFDIFCGLFVDRWNEAFTLAPQFITEIGNRNLEITFDIYKPTDSWDDNIE